MSAPVRYYAARGGHPAGPYTVAELRRLMNAQELSLDDQVCLEGGQEWVKVRDVRAIVPRDPGPAAAEASQARAPRRAAAPTSAAAQASGALAGIAAVAAGTARAASRPDYRPGAAPTLPGIYLPFAATADELLLQLEALENPPPAPPDPTAPLRRTRVVLTLLLLGLSALACAVDARLEYPHAVFSMLTPFAWLGVIVVWLATRPPRRRPAWFRTGLGCGAVALVPIMLMGLALFFEADARVYSSAAWVLGSGVALLAAFLSSASAKPPQAPDIETVLPQLRMTREVLAALRDDLAPGKRVSGWLDLTGHDQPGKLVRSGTAANGAQVELFRDEWWRLRVPLRDGNDLRISAVDRVKQRREFWKRNARGKQKRKPGRSQSLRTLEVRLGVNTAVYGIARRQEAVKIGQLDLAPLTFAEKALSAVVASPDAPPSKDVLGVLAAFYRQLQPLAPGTGGA